MEASLGKTLDHVNTVDASTARAHPSPREATAGPTDLTARADARCSNTVSGHHGETRVPQLAERAMPGAQDVRLAGNPESGVAGRLADLHLAGSGMHARYARSRRLPRAPRE